MPKKTAVPGWTPPQHLVVTETSTGYKVLGKFWLRAAAEIEVLRLQAQGKTVEIKEG